MLDHSDEYFNQFEFADVLADHEYNPETGVNPFLHVTLHAISEKQVQDRNPIEAFQFYNAMLRNKCSRHEAIHLLNIILVKFIFQILKEKNPFPLESYRNILKAYKSRNPKKINRLVEDIQGHSIPETVVRRRFDKGLYNFFHYYQPIIDSWVIFDNSQDTPKMIAYEESSKLEILDPSLYNLLLKYTETK